MEVSLLKQLKSFTKFLISFFLAGLIIVPLLINGLMYAPIPTPSSLDASDWLSFWGGYLGGIVGSAAALIALFATYKQAERHHDDDLENRRLGTMPYIDVRYTPYTCCPRNLDQIEWFGTVDEQKGFEIRYTSSEQQYYDFCEEHYLYDMFYIMVSNIGLGPAADVTLWYGDFNFMLNGIGVNSSRTFLLAFYFANNEVVERTFSITFADAFGNEYEQHLPFSTGLESEFTFESLSPPKPATKK